LPGILAERFFSLFSDEASNEEIGIQEFVKVMTSVYVSDF
jgi:hypothetical protein